MADISIDGTKLTGVLRLTWMSDQLAHVLEHSQADEPSGTWTGLACPDHGFALGADVDTAILQPPKPEIQPSPRILERAAGREADMEAAE